MWNNVLRAGAEPGDVLPAAQADLQADRRAALGGAEPALELSFRADVPGRQLIVTVSSAARPDVRTVVLELAAVTRAASRGIAPLMLLACALTAPRPLRESYRFPSIGPSERPASGDPQRADPRTAGLHRELSAHPDVVLVGELGTHKTALAASLADAFVREGNSCIWFDARDGWAGAESVAWQLLRTARRGEILVVINHLHVTRSTVGRLLHLARLLHTDYELPIRVLVTSRPALVDSSRILFGGLHRVTIGPPESEPLRDAEWAAVHWFACLKLFDIGPPESLVHRRYPDELVRRLGRPPSPVLVKISAHYSLAPDQDAVALIRRSRVATLPGVVIWDYLKSIGAAGGSDLLFRLDEGDFPSAAELAGHSYLAPAWDLLFRLGETLDQRCAADPTWSDNVGAAVFAAEALAELGHARQWSLVAGYIRTRWRYDEPGELPRVVGAPTKEQSDFLEIQQSMSIEDAYLEMAQLSTRRRTAAPASAIDLDRFHRTWMLGVLLGFEGTALDGSEARTKALTSTAAAAIDPDEGWFYPRRVPWVTARVVLGLSRLGLRCDNSDTVRRACMWLKRPLREGGVYGGWWKGGTGSWNRDDATTAMCVAALIRAGDGDAPEVHQALAWLNSRSGEWTKTDREIDLAQVLEANLLGATEWRSSYPRMLNLLHWANSEIRRPGAERFVPESALRAPLAAAQLAVLVREAIERESKLLVEPETAHLPRPRRATEPHPGPATGVQPLPSLARWRDAAEAVRAALRDKIRHMDIIIVRMRSGRDADVVRDQRRTDQQRLDNCDAWIAGLADRTPPATLDSLRSLGIEVCGEGWSEGLTYRRPDPR